MLMRSPPATRPRPLLWACLSLLAGYPALPAQDPATLPPSVTAPRVAEKPEDATIQLQFPNNSIGDVPGFTTLTGKAIVKETGIFEGKPISLVTSKPITRAEAIELIESSLQLNGYVLTEAPDG